MLTTSPFDRQSLAITVGVSIMTLLWLWNSSRKNKKKADQPTLISSELVSTTSPVEEQRETLSEVDEWQCSASHWLPFCVKFDSVLEIDKIKKGLERTLQHIPALGARVDSTSGPFYQLVLSPENHGVELEYAKGSSQQSRLPDDNCSREAWKEAGLEAPSPSFSGTPSLNDVLMKARLTVFEKEGVSYLLIGISHGLCDGHGVVDILQTWSHFCSYETADGLEETLKTPRAFGQRIYEAMRPAKDKQELEARVVSDTGCSSNPLGNYMFFGNVLPKLLWCLPRQENLEVRVNAQKMKQLKAHVMSKLGGDDWVSRYEVLCATLLTIKQMAAAKSTTKLHVACDLRGRSKRFPVDYFGNAAFDFSSKVDLTTIPFSASSWDEVLNPLAMLSCQVHKHIRERLKDPEGICKTKDWFEAARHLGLKNTHDIWAPVVPDCLDDSGVFVNSWETRFLSISMGGSGKMASSMMVYFGTIPNLIVEVPRDASTGDTTINMALLPVEAKKFKELCRQEAGKAESLFPFSITT